MQAVFVEGKRDEETIFNSWLKYVEVPVGASCMYLLICFIFCFLFRVMYIIFLLISPIGIPIDQSSWTISSHCCCVPQNQMVNVNFKEILKDKLLKYYSNTSSLGSSSSVSVDTEGNLGLCHDI